MNYKAAADFVLPFGKYKGKTLDAAAVTNEGLLWLDWIRGERQGKREPLDLALAAYLDDPTIARAIADLAHG
jgi:uncharacterized protein (DUF3820 family)